MRKEAIAFTGTPAPRAAPGEFWEFAPQKLRFQVLFHTGADRLTARGKAKVSALASFLRQHSHLRVHLAGHADPRGTDEYNNVLSEHRALAVQNMLETLGVKPDRIVRRAFGASQSRAEKGNAKHYARERRVDIQMTED